MAPLDHLQDHIVTIAKHEQEVLARRTPAERLGDYIAGYIGNLGFVAAHMALFVLWVLANTIGIPWLPRFDPYPFQLLAALLAMEAILLASFIVMRQARLARRADERDHLMLQILLLTEKEVTAVLKMDRQIAASVGLPGVAKDKELDQLAKRTSIDEVVQNIQETMSAEE